MDDYKKYKPKLREEFSYACAYCETRETELGGSQSFHIDHYRPKKIFPELTYSYNNLIYACRNCNQYKSDFWPKFRQLILGNIIFNPRPIGNIKKHIDTSSNKWTGKTNSGLWSIKRLRLDSNILIKRRERRATFEKAIKRLKSIYEENEKNLSKAIDEELEEDIIKKIKSDMYELEKEISAIESQIYGAMD
ncbi:TPA: HNH endonuclease [Legionella pneumophila]|nr:HNH endonuclease [Legionella pneumophila]